MTKQAEAQFSALHSEEHARWKQHREVLLNVPTNAVDFRGGVGLAMLVIDESPAYQFDLHTQHFISDSVVRWLSLIDIPKGCFDLGGKNREVHYLVKQTTKGVDAGLGNEHYGMPRICLRSGAPEDRAWDFRVIPADDRSVADALSPADYPQVFRVANSVNWGMTVHAFMHRGNWRNHASKLPPIADLPSQAKSSVSPLTWMPRPYLPFDEEIIEDLFSRSTRISILGPSRMPYPMQLAFLNAMSDGGAYRARFAGKVTGYHREPFNGIQAIRLTLTNDNGLVEKIRFSSRAQIARKVDQTYQPGDEIGREIWEMPDDWSSRPVEQCWFELPSVVGKVRAHVRMWVERQYLRFPRGTKRMPQLNKRVFVPGDLCELAAPSSVVLGEMLWDVSRSVEPYYAESSAAFVFPPIPINRWNDLSGILPYGVSYDFTPDDSRFKPDGLKRRKQ